MNLMYEIIKESLLFFTDILSVLTIIINKKELKKIF